MITGTPSGQAAVLIPSQMAPHAEEARMLAREVVLQREEVRLHHQAEPHEDARQDAADQQRADRHARGGAVDHHQDRRRDHGAHGRGAGGEAHRELLVVAALLHRRAEDRADGGGVGGARAGDAGQEHAHDHVHVGQPAAQVPDHRHRELHQALRDAAVGHDVAGEEEERQREQREGVDAGEHLLDRDHERQVRHPDDEQRAQDEGERDRHAQDEEQRQRDEQQRQRMRQHGARVRPGRSCPAGAPALRPVQI